MLQRCWEHDYCEPCFYMITIVTEPRRNCLSRLREDASLELSPLGEVVAEVWRRTNQKYEHVEACRYVVMPDHFHGILWVKERLKRPMGHIVKAFKRVATQECRSKGLLLQPDSSKGLLLRPDSSKGLLLRPNHGPVSAAAPAAESSLWQEGFQDSILLRRGQLRNMTNYIIDNPRRLAAKLANPELFTVVCQQEVAPGRRCPVIGNRFLLQHPLKRQIQISRRISEEAMAEKQEELLYAAAHGSVLVSPCISPGEKAIARAAMEAGYPLIVLLENGFKPHYKPPGRYFEACASGRLLMMAPFPHHSDKRTITRDQCLTLNAWAEAIAQANQ
jgi:REP element-mobilizing transposase RayT